MQYYQRTIEGSLKQALQDTPVVCLLGPRQSGKTTLARHLAPERSYFSLDDYNLLTPAFYIFPAESPSIRGSFDTRIDSCYKAPSPTLSFSRISPVKIRRILCRCESW